MHIKAFEFRGECQQEETFVWLWQPADHMLLLSPPVVQPWRVQKPAPETRTASRAPMTSNYFRMPFFIIWPAKIHVSYSTHLFGSYNQSQHAWMDVQGLPKMGLLKSKKSQKKVRSNEWLEFANYHSNTDEFSILIGWRRFFVVQLFSDQHTHSFRQVLMASVSYSYAEWLQLFKLLYSLQLQHIQI